METKLGSDVGTHADGSQARRESLLQILAQAIDLTGDERESAIRERCAGDPDLENDVRRMLSAETEVLDFLEQPAVEAALLLDAAIGADEALPDEALPEYIGRYEIIRSLGTGGMGNVYLASQKLDDFERLVAVKVIKRGMDSDAVVSRFRIERSILGSLNHPNIAKLLDAGTTDDGRAFFAMEYVDGQRITDYCDAHRLSVEARLDLFDTICRAVHHAHQNVVVHRDLKPSNILVTGSGTVKLLDFGVAKLLDPNAVGFTIPVTELEFAFVTPEYASPEQLRGEVVSTSSDVFSLGVLLYELLSGHRPFGEAATTRAELVRRICEEDPKRTSAAVAATSEIRHRDGSQSTVTPSSVGQGRSTTDVRLVAALRGDLDNIVMRAIRKDPGERYASVEQFREDVQRYRDGEPIIARPATVRYRLRKLYTRNRRVFPIAAAVLIGIIGMTAYYVHDLRVQRTTAQEAFRKAENVKQFVIGLFEQGTYAAGTTTTLYTDEQMRAAMTLLEPALDDIDRFDDDPASQLAILNVVAEVLSVNDNHERALEVLARARQIDHANIASTDRADTDYTLGRAFLEAGQRDSAFYFADRSYELRNAVLGPLHPRTLGSLALTARTSTDTSIAYARSRLGAKLYAEAFGAVSVELANYLSDVPAPPTEGVERLERAVDLYRQTTGLGHPLAATTMANLALQVEVSDSARALRLTDDAKTILEETLGPDHPLSLATLRNLGAMHAERRNYVTADSMLGAVESRWRMRIPDYSRSVSLAYWQGLAKFGLGDNAAAEDRFRTVREAIPVSHRRYAETAARLGLTIARQGRIAEARSLLTASLDSVMALPETNGSEAWIEKALAMIGE